MFRLAASIMVGVLTACIALPLVGRAIMRDARREAIHRRQTASVV